MVLALSIDVEVEGKASWHYINTRRELRLREC